MYVETIGQDDTWMLQELWPLRFLIQGAVMTINSPRLRTESERRQSEADELEFKPGPVPPIRPVDRYGFVKSAPTSPASGPTKGRPQSERERSVLSFI